MTATVSATLTVDTTDVEASPLAYRLASLAFATVVPAVFWVVTANWIAKVAGVQVPFAALLAVGMAIAAFLGSVCAPIVLKRTLDRPAT